MLLPGLVCLLFGASGDSLAISRARESLVRGDTLEAIEVLQDWSSEHAVGQELTNLLGALHMPDEPAETRFDSVAVVAAPVSVKKAGGRSWNLRSDEAITYTDGLAWSAGAGAATRIAEFGLFGRSTALEAGVAGAVWNGADDELRGAFDPMLMLAMMAGRWDARWDAWAGWMGDRADFGSLASVSRLWSDSVGGSLRLGAAARAASASTSYLNGFCQFEKRRPSWVGTFRADLRVRHDRLDGDSTSVDSLRLRVHGDRIQSVSRLQFLWVRGHWQFGPAVDVDLRRSLSSDSWYDGTRRRSEVRQELVGGAQGVLRFAPKSVRWAQARVGWIQGFSASKMDPGFSDRNTGLASAISLGGSF